MESSLQWSPNHEPDIAGYRVFHRVENQDYDYDAPVWEGSATSCTIYNLDENMVNCFVARAYDTEGFESVDSEEACKLPQIITNQPPIANAGPDQTVDAGSRVQLNGSASVDIDDGIATYTWYQLEGPAVTLSDPYVPQASFNLPQTNLTGVSLLFCLDVADNSGLHGSDTCIVNISSQNQPPIAAVAQDYIEISGGAMVVLDGSGSTDDDDGIAGYMWTQVEGNPVELSNPVFAKAWFTAPETAQYGSNLVFDLTVTDRGGLKSSAESVVYVLPNVNQNHDLANDAYGGSGAQQNNESSCFIGTTWYP